MKDFAGKVAVVTGAGSGFGREFARIGAQLGMKLSLADIQPEALAATVDELRGQGAQVIGETVDVSRGADVERLAQRTLDAYGAVHLLFNNAGVALVADIATMSDEDLHWLVDINLWGVVNGCRAFLPHLEASGEGHIVNLSSVFGLISIPSQSAYNLAKFGVRGFSDALRMELEIADSCVSVTTVHPGGVKTNIARQARKDPGTEVPTRPGQDLGDAFERIARTTPEDAAHQIIAGVQGNRRRTLVGFDAKVIDFVSRLPAGFYQRVLVNGVRLAGRFS